MKNTASQVREWFFQGLYSKISALYNQHPKAFSIEQSSWLLGALSLQGQILEAEEYFRNYESQMSAAQKSAGLFYLGIGLTRKSKYKKSRSLFKKNLELHKNSQDPLAQFFIYQGFAFYFYFVGQLEKAARASHKALRFAIAAHDPIAKVLAQDLHGHALVQTGSVRVGLGILQLAQRQALQNKNLAFAQSIEISSLLYEAQNGFRPQSVMNELETVLKKFGVEDNYTKVNIQLEMARQLTLRGKFFQARQHLDEITPIIFSHQNRRQEIGLYIRGAELASLQGKVLAARQQLRSAELCLHREVDQTLRQQIQEIELCLEKNRPFFLEHSKISEENELQNLWNEISSAPSQAISNILSTGYLSWLYKELPISPGENVFYLGLESSVLTIFSSDGVEMLPLAALSIHLIEALSQGLVNKSELVEKIWGYSYHPLRHDPLVYAALSSLRKSLGQYAHWIVTSEEGYSLRTDVRVLKAAHLSRKKEISPNRSTLPKVIELNHRQIQALEYLQQIRFMSTKIYVELIKTSEITACRDLSSLSKKGYVLRIGHGRATQYTLSGRIG